MLFCLAELNSDTGKKLLCIKRLGHVICRTAQQKIYLVLHIYFCAENDNRNVLNVGQNLAQSESPAAVAIKAIWERTAALLEAI